MENRIPFWMPLQLGQDLDLKQWTLWDWENVFDRVWQICSILKLECCQLWWIELLFILVEFWLSCLTCMVMVHPGWTCSLELAFCILLGNALRQGKGYCVYPLPCLFGSNKGCRYCISSMCMDVLLFHYIKLFFPNSQACKRGVKIQSCCNNLSWVAQQKKSETFSHGGWSLKNENEWEVPSKYLSELDLT